MNYSFITEFDSKCFRIYDELRTLIDVAVPKNEIKPGSVRRLYEADRIYASKLKNGNDIYITDNVTPPTVVINNSDGIYIATIAEDENDDIIYIYLYYDEDAKKIIEDNLKENESFDDIARYIKFELERYGLLPDIRGDYYLDELEGTNGIIDVIEKLKQDKQKQKVKA